MHDEDEGREAVLPQTAEMDLPALRKSHVSIEGKIDSKREEQKST